MFLRFLNSVGMVEGVKSWDEEEKVSITVYLASLLSTVIYGLCPERLHHQNLEWNKHTAAHGAFGLQCKK